MTEDSGDCTNYGWPNFKPVESSEYVWSPPIEISRPEMVRRSLEVKADTEEERDRLWKLVVEASRS
jgi:hypothetical protein